MRFGLVALSLVTVSIALLGCERGRGMSIELRTQSESLYRCDDLAIDELHPENGGWRFRCSDGSNVYFIYETHDTPARGTIEYIDIQRDGASLTLLPAYRVNDVADLDCPSAKALGATAGGAPLRMGMLGPAAGTYTVELARPCGTLEIVLGEK